MLRNQLISYLIFLLSLTVGLAQENKSTVPKLQDLPKHIVQAINDYEVQSYDKLIIPEQLVPLKLQTLRGGIKTVTEYISDLPTIRTWYDRNGNLSGYFIPSTKQYEIFQFYYDANNSIISSDDFEISRVKDSLYFVSKKDSLSYCIFRDAKKRAIEQYVYTPSGVKWKKLQSNKYGYISKAITSNEEEQSEISYKYDKKKRLKSFTEKTIIPGGKAKEETKKFEYNDANLIVKSEFNNQISNYSYSTENTDSTLTVIAEVKSNKGLPILRSYTFDRNENLIAYTISFGDKVAYDKRYAIEYFEALPIVESALECLITRNYFKLHESIDSISLIKVGDGYGRKVEITNLSKYKFLLTQTDNRFLENKPNFESILLPKIEITGKEEIYENDKAKYYKIFFKENMEFIFQDSAKRDKQLIRHRGFFRGHSISKDKMDGKKTYIQGDGEYLLYKLDKRTKVWSQA